MSPEIYHDGVLRQQWNDDTRIYTEWNQDGTLVPSTPTNPNPRPYSERENALADLRSPAATQSPAEQTLRAQGRTALTANATYLATVPHTAAEAAAQVEALTRQCSALIRLINREFQ
jgi:hypothetical protein